MSDGVENSAQEVQPFSTSALPDARVIQTPEVSILILTHNARKYIRKTLASLGRTTNVRYEVLVVDNASNWLTKWMLLRWQSRKWIDRLLYLYYNSLFAEGNNIASRLANPHAPYFLLLNSDVEIRNCDWLRLLLDAHRPGISAYGVVHGDPITRVDGYCLLIDSKLYREHLLDESFQWWWSVTKLQAHILTSGYSVQGYAEHENQIHHFGRKSGGGFRGAKGMGVSPEEVVGWFKGRTVTAYDSVPGCGSRP